MASYGFTKGGFKSNVAYDNGAGEDACVVGYAALVVGSSKMVGLVAVVSYFFNEFPLT